MNKLLLAASICLIFCSALFGQDGALTNKDVIELTKAGIAEDIILAKIKSSECNFDTSSNGLIELKSSNASDNVILAILDCSKASSETKPFAKNDSVYTIADAAGKRKVFIDSEDEQSELAIAKELKKRRFEIVNNRSSADIVIDFGIERVERLNTGLYGYGRVVERSIGKMVVYLRIDQDESLIFAREKNLGFVGQLLHKQAVDLTEAFVKELAKAESSKK